MGTTYSSTGATPRTYPEFPPSCNSCPPPPGVPFNAHGFIGVPSNATCYEFFGPNGCTPLVVSLVGSPFTLLYWIWGITVALALIWALYRHTYELYIQRRVFGVDLELDIWPAADVGPDDFSAPPNMAQSPRQGNRLMTVQYLRSSWSETFAVAVYAFNGLVIFIFYTMLTIDFYVDCQNGGTIDSACYFGSFRLMGDYQANTEAFFLVWCALVAYVFATALGWRWFLDFVRVPCGPEAADKVRVWVQDEEKAIGYGRVSFAVRVKRTIGARSSKAIMRLALKLWDKTSVLEMTRSGRHGTVPVHTSPLGSRYFVFECRRYCVPGEAPIVSMLRPSTVREMREQASNPMASVSRQKTLDMVGGNEMPLLPPTYSGLLAQEFFSPFYAYQIVIYLMWIYWTYWWVGIVLLSIVIGSGVVSVLVKRRNLIATHALAAHKDSAEMLADAGSWQTVDARALVPGDVVKVRGGGWTVPADLVLVEGSCAADESSLTGETMPSAKSSLPRTREEDGMIVNIADAKWKGHAMFAGTVCLDASIDCAAVVVATGIDATRGQLLAGVLFPTKAILQFDEEFAVVVTLLFGYALVVLTVSLTLQGTAESQSSWTTMFMFGVFCVSQIVSPLLKIALVAGQLASAQRLGLRGITCIDTSRIDVAGTVSLFCFDKTGTLTRDGLSLVSVLRAGAEGGLTPVTLEGERLAVHSRDHLERAMAACHSVGTFRGALLGSAVETSMFAATQWKLVGSDEVEFDKGALRLQVVRRLAFDRARRTMGVVALAEANAPMLYVKGAPEAVLGLCSDGGASKRSLAADLAAGGGYVLAIACRNLAGWSARAVADASRDDLERSLTLLGLIVFRNELKPDARETVAELQRGGVRVAMITGDNLLTGVFIARQAGLLEGAVICGEAVGGQVKWTGGVDASSGVGEEIALSGDAFEVLLKSGEVHRLLNRIVVFARTSPQQKVAVVRAFMEGSEGQVVAYAGDGSNDLGALQAASVGLSLGTQESSVVATFTSKSRAVQSCAELLREGRGSVATSVSTFKLLVIYGLLFSIINMASFYYAVLMPLMGYLFVDLLAVVPLTFAMTLAKPLDQLQPYAVDASLLGARTVASVMGVFVVSMATLGVNMSIMRNAPGYVRWPAKYFDTAAWWFASDNWESTVIWVSTFYVFIFSSFSFSFGSFFRKGVFHNVVLQGMLLFLFLMTTCVFLTAPNSFSAVFHIASEQFNANNTLNPVWQQYQAAGGETSPAMSESLRWEMFFFTMVGVAFQIFWEKAFVQGPAGPWLARRLPCIGGGGN